MKMIYYFVIGISVLMLNACESSTETVKTVNHGPVTESDKIRYNLNPTDEIRYGSPDSLDNDSLQTDTLVGARHN